MQTQFLLVRHAESTWNAASRWQGHADPPLSERGRAQAARLAQRLADLPVDLLWCSDLRRARETAEALAKQWGLTPDADARFRELDVGRWTGLRTEEIEAREPELLGAFRSEQVDIRPGGGETRAEIRIRVRRALLERAEKTPARRIALVTHLGVIRALCPGRDPSNADALRATLEELHAAWPRSPIA